MEPQNIPLPRFWRVRPAIWLLLTGSVLLTVVAPAFVLWHASASPLAARAYLWPATPRAGDRAYVVVNLTDPRDRTAVNGPWAQVLVNWDMATMPMGTRAVVLHGPTDADRTVPLGEQAGTYAIPLQLTMTGPWWAQISLRTPGRPAWSTTLRFLVREPARADSPAPPPRTARSLGGTA